jgi:hypothetical protein
MVRDAENPFILIGGQVRKGLHRTRRKNAAGAEVPHGASGDGGMASPSTEVPMPRPNSQ